MIRILNLVSPFEKKSLDIFKSDFSNEYFDKPNTGKMAQINDKPKHTIIILIINSLLILPLIKEFFVA